MDTSTVIHTLRYFGPRATQESSFYQDVVRGLTSTPKHLDSKYFYDAEGDRLFQQIMQCREYYLTDCEMEIMQEQAGQIAQALTERFKHFDLVELGPGDATKSIHLLRELLQQKAGFTYYPIDISGNVISQLEKELPGKLPGLQLQGMNGEYFEMLKQVTMQSSQPKVLLFMGANIGNFTPAAARKFCRSLYHSLQPGDLLMVGFDLKKHPQVILSAYNDSAGITRDFNLNLLHRINRELQADFDPSLFEHYPVYDPGSGACKSYLVSLREHEVHIGREVTVHFDQYEPLYMEISQKYNRDDIAQLALQSGFEVLTQFMDRREWFADYLWKRI
jgi:dimethylhistidine N-methyltransferase